MGCCGIYKNPVSQYVKIKGGKRCRHLITRINSNLPAISIVTAVYNSSSTIEESIRSVISQNYDNFEYIIVDGASTDGTVEMLKRYEDQIDYWISEPDKGVYDALNKGIELAKGDWIYFLGADDVLVDSDVLKRVFAVSPKGKFIYGNVLWGDTGRVYDGVFSKGKLIWHNICHQSIFYHKKLFSSMGKFDARYPLLADWVFNMRVFANRFVNPHYIDTIVARYSLSGRSSTKTDKAFLANREQLIYRIFGFRYYHLFINNYAGDTGNMVAYGYKRGFVYFLRDVKLHLEHLNNLSKTNDGRLSVLYVSLGWRTLSRVYKYWTITLPQRMYKYWTITLPQRMYKYMNLIFPRGSMSRKLISKIYNLICKTANKPAK